MIVFETLRYKNILSTGNNFTELKLNEKSVTIVIGKNGSGKSSFLDALSFCLYNKAFRNINKPQLINSVNQKQLLVEVEFQTNGNSYLIRRGMRPNIFEIYQDSILLNQVADTRDYQSILENNILKMNHRSFRQIVILGSADFIPFMQLPAQARREIIEDLLDLQVFSVMNSILKAKIQNNKEESVNIEHQIVLQETLLEEKKKHLNELRQNNEEIISLKNSKIEQLKKDNEDFSLKLQELGNALEDKRKEQNPALSDKLREAIVIKDKFNSSIDAAKKKIDFFLNNDICPTCAQSITLEFKQDNINKFENRCDSTVHKLNLLQNTIEKLNIKISHQNEILSEINTITSSLIEVNNHINTNNKIMSNIEKEIKQLLQKNNTILSNNEIDNTIIDKLNTIKAKKASIIDERELLGVASVLLKDGGIKSKIIKHHIPVMNTLINKYLHMMEFYIDFQLDENFKEIIYSRGRNDFSYASFSQGEKMRIDLSILFTWRAISKMRNSSATNLLIFDEIFDSSLDSQGIDDFIKIIQTLTADTNTFIISHKLDILVDKFENVIRFEKHKNFSRIV